MAVCYVYHHPNGGRNYEDVQKVGGDGTVRIYNAQKVYYMGSYTYDDPYNPPLYEHVWHVWDEASDSMVETRVLSSAVVNRDGKFGLREANGSWTEGFVQFIGRYDCDQYGGDWCSSEPADGGSYYTLMEDTQTYKHGIRHTRREWLTIPAGCRILIGMSAQSNQGETDVYNSIRFWGYEDLNGNLIETYYRWAQTDISQRPWNQNINTY